MKQKQAKTAGDRVLLSVRSQVQSLPGSPLPPHANTRSLYQICSRLLELGTQEAKSEFVDLARYFHRDPEEIRKEVGKWREDMRRYKREWAAARRREMLAILGPCAKCGSTARIEMDHVDPASKVAHRIQSWNRDRRAEEMAKCQALCKSCHVEKTARERAMSRRGRLVTEAEARSIRSAYDDGVRTGKRISYRTLAVAFDLDHATIGKIVRGTYRAFAKEAA